MSVGAVLYSAGTAKLSELGGLAGRLPLVMLAYVVAGLSISGMPIFNGFVSKTMTIAGAFDDHRVLLGMLMEVAAVGTFLSVGLKLPYFAFWGGKPTYAKPLKPIPVNMYIAMGAAAFLCIAQGLYPDLLYRFLPYPGAENFHPWSSWKVLMTLLLLGFTGLGFMVMRKVLTPHAQRNLDFEALYIYLGRSFLALVSRPLARLDSIWSEVYKRVGWSACCSWAGPPPGLTHGHRLCDRQCGGWSSRYRRHPDHRPDRSPAGLPGPGHRPGLGPGPSGLVSDVMD
jgi:multicomponent Na+:H+ antiporter subunit D